MTAVSNDEWQAAQRFEAGFHGDCLNTYGEETKQLTYAELMGLAAMRADHYPVYDLGHKSVLDIGGGPASILLKCINRGPSTVADPLKIPKWAIDRYQLNSILYDRCPAERFVSRVVGSAGPAFDEAWIYNVLQHVVDPEQVIATARREARQVRIFEWIDMPAYEGHPHSLRSEQLIDWLGEGKGRTIVLDGINGCYGRAFYGVFAS
jgi:hypothetical protein